MPRGLTPSQAQIAFSAGMPVAAVIGGDNFPSVEVIGYLTKRDRKGAYVFQEFDPGKPNADFPVVKRFSVFPQDLRIIEVKLPSRPPLPERVLVVKKKPEDNRQANPELLLKTAIRQLLNPEVPFKRSEQSYKRF